VRGEQQPQQQLHGTSGTRSVFRARAHLRLLLPLMPSTLQPGCDADKPTPVCCPSMGWRLPHRGAAAPGPATAIPCTLCSRAPSGWMSGRGLASCIVRLDDTARHRPDSLNMQQCDCRTGPRPPDQGYSRPGNQQSASFTLHGTAYACGLLGLHRQGRLVLHTKQQRKVRAWGSGTVVLWQAARAARLRAAHCVCRYAGVWRRTGLKSASLSVETHYAGTTDMAAEARLCW
jgi:hypothetical protein